MDLTTSGSSGGFRKVPKTGPDFEVGSLFRFETLIYWLVLLLGVLIVLIAMVGDVFTYFRWHFAERALASFGDCE